MALSRTYVLKKAQKRTHVREGTSEAPSPMRGGESPIFLPIKHQIFRPFRYEYMFVFVEKMKKTEKEHTRAHTHVVRW